jgi:hypothetical protein
MKTESSTSANPDENTVLQETWNPDNGHVTEVNTSLTFRELIPIYKKQIAEWKLKHEKARFLHQNSHEWPKREKAFALKIYVAVCTIAELQKLGKKQSKRK